MATATGDAKSLHLANAILDHVLGGGDYARPATVYLALYTVPPADAGGTEVFGGSYARVAITNNATNFPAASGGSKTLATEQTFPEATGSWGTVVAVGVYDAATNGNLLYWTAITSQGITTGSIPTFAADSLTFSET